MGNRKYIILKEMTIIFLACLTSQLPLLAICIYFKRLQWSQTNLEFNFWDETLYLSLVYSLLIQYEPLLAEGLLNIDNK